MNKNLFASIVFTFAVTLLFAQTEKPLQEKNGIKIYVAPASAPFADAELHLAIPQTINEGKDTFNFELKNYTLGAQTPDADQKMCANSAKGQHIHFILDNAPYYASYNSQIVQDVKPGHHVLLAFLSRSYHEIL